MNDLFEIPSIEFAPFLFLEGQEYFSSTEEILIETCDELGIEHEVICGLYNRPEQIKKIDELKPKSIVLGTTGVYHEKLKNVLSAFEACSHLPDNIFLTMGEEILAGTIRKYKEVKPTIKVYGVYPLSKMFDKKFSKAYCDEIIWI